MALPTFNINSIPEEGLCRSCRVLPDELGLGKDEARFVGELELSLEVVKREQRVHVTGWLRGGSLRECVRCLKAYEEPVRVPFSVVYRYENASGRGHPKLSGDQAPGSQEGAEDPDTGDVYCRTGEELNLAEMLREQVILAIPMQPLCAEACRGLCPVCGQDRNVSQCGCPEERPDNPFAILRELRNSMDQTDKTRPRAPKVGPKNQRR
jgi:uncharacterized protein